MRHKCMLLKANIGLPTFLFSYHFAEENKENEKLPH